jgi:hypothetical protein
MAAAGMAATIAHDPRGGAQALADHKARGRVKPNDPRARPLPKPGAMIGANAAQIAKAECEAGCHKGGGKGMRHPQQAAKRKVCLRRCR